VDIPLIEQMKIQAQALVPLVRALQEELGEQRANAIVRKALWPLYRSYGDKWWRAQNGPGLGEKMASAFEAFAAGNALDDVDVVRRTPDAFAVNVTRCRYAEFCQAIGAADLGFVLTCSADFALAEGYEGVRLTRTQTIMQGASHCDFRYALERGPDESG